MIKRILVGLGGTPFTSVSIQRAVELAKIHQAQTTGVTVLDLNNVEKVGPVPVGAGIYAQRMRERKKQVTREAIENTIDTFKSHCSEQNVACRRIEYEQQEPFSAMISEARYNDLTIFGLRSIFDYGFTSDPNKAIVKLINHGVRPILAVSEQLRPIKKALIAYSGSMESAKAMRQFLHLRPWSDIELQIVHFKQGKASEDILLKNAADFCAAHGFEVKTDLVTGNAHLDLLPFARENEADIIVMGNSIQTTLIKQLLGDTVLETIKNADRPLFLSQ